MVKKIGFPWLMRGMAIANILYAPVCYFLRETPTREENKVKIQRKLCRCFLGPAAYTLCFWRPVQFLDLLLNFCVPSELTCDSALDSNIFTMS